MFPFTERTRFPLVLKHTETPRLRAENKTYRRLARLGAEVADIGARGVHNAPREGARGARREGSYVFLTLF